MSRSEILFLFWMFILLNFLFWYYISPIKEAELNEQENFVELEMIRVQEENEALFCEQEREEEAFIYNVQNARSDTIVLKLLKERLHTVLTQRWAYQQEAASSKEELYKEMSVMSDALKTIESMDSETNLENYTKLLRGNFDENKEGNLHHIWGSVVYIIHNELQYIK